MTQQHPITPPQSLISERERNLSLGCDEDAIFFARWGADAELDACVKWLKEQRWEALAIHLRSARRPKPPSLKERGREALQNIHAAVVMETGGRELDVLKEIVESLPD